MSDFEKLQNLSYDYIPSAEEMERIMAYKATMLAMKQIDDGTAKAQVITHYLKQASPRESIERRMMIAKIELLEAQLQACRSDMEVQQLILSAMDSLKTYKGDEDVEDIY